jgi:class 3 adenylate cyclase
MAEPQVQYAKTSDGVSIAYATLGEGMPLVILRPTIFGHLQMEWQNAKLRSWFERLALGRRLVQLDSRGSGLSDRNIADISLDSLVLDLEAVIDGLAFERFALMASGLSGPVAIAFATRHPRRVSHLILWCAWDGTSDTAYSQAYEATRVLIHHDWELYTETASHVLLGWEAGEQARSFAKVLRESITPEIYQAYHDARTAFGVTDLLPKVECPTLVLHRREVPWPPLDGARNLASHIPDARIVLLEGESPVPFLGDMDAAVDAIDDFLGEGEEAEAAKLPEGMAVILFADIVESTSLTEQLGDTAFRAKARELDEALRAIIRECSGTPVEGKVLGDGVLAVFTSARQAIECALRCNGASEAPGLRLHLGIHAGDVIREGNNVYGGAVNIAARIAAASAPGEVLVSDTVRGLARTSAGVAFDDRGEHTLKGVGEPQRLFAVREGNT